MGQIKVLQIIDSLQAGGAESLLANFLVQTASDPRYEMEVCTLYEKGIFSDKLESAGIKVHNLALRWKYDFIGVKKLINLVNRNNYTIIHVHLFPADLFTALASFVSQNPYYIFSEHSEWNRRRQYRIFRLIDKFVYSRYDAVVCGSQRVRNTLLKWVPPLKQKATVVYYGVPIPPTAESKVKDLDILFVGRLIRAKGLDVLFRALYLLRETGLTPSVAIVGIGDFENYLKELVDQLGIQDQITFLGTGKDINYLMQRAKVFVLPSRWEGLPIVILEAMSAQLPIITTSVGGIPEILENQRDALIVPPENPQALADAILRLLKDQEFAHQLASTARYKVEESFSIKAYVKRITGLYDRILGGEAPLK